jgi:hypothetical protein
MILSKEMDGQVKPGHDEPYFTATGAFPGIRCRLIRPDFALNPM